MRGGGEDREHVVDADVQIGASVTAKSLRFRSRPQVDVILHGEAIEPGQRSRPVTASASERENLPETIEPGVTYRDVSIRWGAAARLREPAAPREHGRIAPEPPG